MQWGGEQYGPRSQPTPLRSLDAIKSLKYCNDAKDENLVLQYAFPLDNEKKLEHIFRSSSQCFDWCQKFRDVVVFHTTYKVNSYEMPFGIFVDADNHGRTALFMCALLRNETISVYLIF